MLGSSRKTALAPRPMITKYTAAAPCWIEGNALAFTAERNTEGRNKRAWWCLEWWISMMVLLMEGSRAPYSYGRAGSECAMRCAAQNVRSCRRRSRGSREQHTPRRQSARESAPGKGRRRVGYRHVNQRCIRHCAGEDGAREVGQPGALPNHICHMMAYLSYASAGSRK